MIFDYNIPILSIVLFSISLLCLFYIAFVYSNRLTIVRKHRLACNAEAESEELAPDTVYPKASVVVYTRNDANFLAENLPLILQQKFPGQFEVIVVNDGVPNESDTIVTLLKQTYHNLYLTFAPDSSRNVSRKKLTITLGIKAARGEVIVVTDAYTKIQTDRWLERIVRPFCNPATEVVIGYNNIKIPEEAFSGRLTTAFDAAADTVAWLSSAIKGNPYRGCGNNIAYRKNLFFSNKGFSNSLVLRDGDDDIFINEIANGDNTCVQIPDCAIGSYGSGYGVRKLYKDFRLSHAFTGRSIPKASRRIMAIGEWLMWVCTACAVAAAILAGITNLFGWLIAFLLILTLSILIIVSWRKTIASLGGPDMCLCIPWLAAFRPLRNIKVNFTCTNKNNPHFTWQ